MPIVDYDKSSEPRWYVMPLMRRGTVLEQARSLRGDFDRVLRGLAGVADALGAMHAKGQTHRDAKPANIFVADDGRWILGDPGIAYMPDREEETSTRIGSKDWLPRWYADEYGRRPETDLYILGAVAVFLLTEKKLLDPTHLTPGRIWLPAIFPDVTEINRLQDLVSQVFVSDPDRAAFRTGTDFAAALRAVADDITAIRTTESHAGTSRIVSRGFVEPRQLFSFGATATGEQSGDHPALQGTNVWIPAGTRALSVYSRFRALQGTRYTLRLKSTATPHTLSLDLVSGEMQVIPVANSKSSYGWHMLTVESSGYGTSHVKALSVHASPALVHDTSTGSER